jgi:membrane protein DedA with SNARE-associated domain
MRKHRLPQHSELLVSQARWIEGMWGAMGALIVGSLALALSSSAGVQSSGLLCAAGGVLGGVIGYWGGRVQAQRLRFQARSVELELRKLVGPGVRSGVSTTRR